MLKDASAVDEEEKNKRDPSEPWPDIHGSGAVGNVWSLTLRFGPSIHLLYLLPSEVKELCLLVGSVLILSCNGRSQQENKLLFFQCPGSHTHTHTQTPLARLLYWRLLIKSAAINIIVTSSTRSTLTIMFYFGWSILCLFVTILWSNS